jgi:transcription antitermination factor NusG
LFPCYVFVLIELQWHTARWAPGVVALVTSAGLPVRVPDAVIAEIRSRERRGLVELPKPSLRRGDRVRVVRGVLERQLGLVAGMRAHERVAVLVSLLGSPRQVTLPVRDVEAAQA